MWSFFDIEDGKSENGVVEKRYEGFLTSIYRKIFVVFIPQLVHHY